MKKSPPRVTGIYPNATERHKLKHKGKKIMEPKTRDVSQAIY